MVGYALDRLRGLGWLEIHGPLDPARRGGLVSFVDPEVHPHDLATILDTRGIAVRAGHHCAMPVMQRFNVPATVRASFALYNTRPEVDALVGAIHEAKEMFG